MKKLVILSLMSLFSYNTQVFSMEDINKHNGDPIVKFVYSVEEQNKNTLEMLPYKYSYNQIKEMERKANLNNKGKIARIKSYYSFVKKSFNILQKQSKELKELFFSNATDKNLIDRAIEIVEKDTSNIIREIFYNPNKVYDINYIRDIIHNNIYSVVITNNNTNINTIQNKYRRELLSQMGNKRIDLSNYKNHFIVVSGNHKDIFDNNKTYLAFSGLDFNIFSELISISKNNNDMTKLLDELYSLVDDGYITDPNVVDYMQSYFALLKDHITPKLFKYYNNIDNDIAEAKRNITEKYAKLLQNDSNINKQIFTSNTYKKVIGKEIEGRTLLTERDQKLIEDEINRRVFEQFAINELMKKIGK